MMNKYTLTVLISLFFSTVALSQTPHTTALDFSVKTLKGDIIQLYPLLSENKIVVVDFFSTSCGPCQTFAYDFEMAYQNFGSNSGNVFFLGINYNGTNSDVIYFDSVFNITLPSASGLDGGGNVVFEAYQVASYPTVVIIKPDKTIASQRVWEPTTANITEAVLIAGGTLVGQQEQLLSNENSLKVYPNPTRNEAVITLDIKQEEDVTLTVRNAVGQTVQVISTSEIMSKGLNTKRIDVKNLPSGVYFVEASSSKFLDVQRLLIHE